jgi:DNA damage-binding protein 1
MVADQQLDFEVACLDLTPLRGATESDVVLVAMWTDLSVRLLETNTLRECHRQTVKGDIVAHSTVLSQFDTEQRWALVGMGDGTLNYLTVDSQAKVLGDPKQVQLASEPLSLCSFINQGKAYVFASSDRPCVIHTRNDKMLFSNVNLPICTTVCPLNTPLYPESLAIATPESLAFSILDNVQNLQIRKLPLLESPIAVAHHAHFHTLLVATVANEASLTADLPIGYLRLYSDRALELLDSYKLEQTESANRVVSMTLHDGTHCFVAATAFIDPDDDYSDKGRVLLFTVVETKLVLLYNHATGGAAMAAHVFKEGLLVGINSRLDYLTWQPDDEVKLQPTASFTGNLMVLELDVRGDFVLVGDVMQSLTVIVWQPETKRFEESASDDTPCYLLSSCMVNQDVFLMTDSLQNLCLCQRNETAGNDEELQRLGTTGRFHLGDAINR